MINILWFFSWYVIITLVGWVAFPIAYRFFPRLPERGYALSRALGWLICGYLFWALGSLGVLQNNLGGVLFAFALVTVLSAACVWGRRWGEMRAWLRERRAYLVAAEVIFLAAFAAMAFIRAANPNIDGTEKPMELAFINAILKSPTLPPHDPWLSGYGISYYYFGYVLVSMLIRASGVMSGVGFNLAIALVFGMTAIGAYGILYNLLALRKRTADDLSGAQLSGPLGLPILGPVFVLLMGNLEGILAMLHDKGIFWTQTGGVYQSGFWKWLGVLDLSDPPIQPLSWLPHYSFIPWWRASRVLADYNLAGSFREVIDEIPFFSYLLSDLHPHVLGMPFAMLMVGLALNVWLSARTEGSSLLGFHIPFDRAGFVMAALLLGALAFLNTWDFPVYIALVAGAYTLGRVQEYGWRWSLVGDFLGLGLLLGIAGVIFYIPFFVGFSSQAGGILPSMIYFTRGTQFWVMFGTLLAPILVFLVYRLARPKEGRPDLERGIAIAVGLVAVLWVGMYGIGLIASQLPSLGGLFMGNLGVSNASIGVVIHASLFGFVSPDGAAFPGRLSAPGAWLSLTVLLGLLIAAIIGLRPQPAEDTAPVDPSANGRALAGLSSGPEAFWLLIVLIGALLALAPEFFYLRDMFGDRMNTIFKFYYTAWILWGLGAAYATAALIQDLRHRNWGVAWRVGAVALLAIGLTYPVWGLQTKIGAFPAAKDLTLDGNAFLQANVPDEMAAVAWLDQQPAGVIAEAVGESYAGETSREATLTGYATVLGWKGHEDQWRGSDAGWVDRIGDLQTLYTTNDWKVAQAIIQKYDIRYIVVGPVERSTYSPKTVVLNAVKFQRNLAPPFKSGDFAIYTVPQTSPLAAENPWNGGTIK
jgi:YYY domain-containing protein